MAKNLLKASTVASSTHHTSGKLKGKPKRYNDGGGLYLIVFKSGLKSWRYNYLFNKKQQTITYGSYPSMSLSEARDAHREAVNLKNQGINPAEKKQLEKYKVNTFTFSVVAKEWYEQNQHTWAKSTATKKAQYLQDYINPFIGDRAANEIEPPEILYLLKKIEKVGKVGTAHRVKQTISQIIRYAVATGRAKRDITLDLKGALKTAVTVHRAAITEPVKVGELLRALDSYQGHVVTQYALKILPYIFVRMGEFKSMEWLELDFDNKQWLIPPEKMKMKISHIVPLADQVVNLLKELSEFTSHSTYVFPSIRTKTRPMSENTINAALRRLGYTKEEMCSHGFRSMASTNLYNMDFSEEEIETQLAHVEKNKVKEAYDRRASRKKLPQRIKMMQVYANYLDSLKQGAEVIPIRANQ